MKLLLVMLASLIVVACGGGGDNPPPATTLSGTAAVGAPIVGATVNVKCAAGAVLSNIPATTATGAWSVTLSGQTLPCAVQVTGGTVNGAANTIAYQSIATSLGTVNITPLTSLLVANLAGTATPDSWFAGLTPAQLSAITSTQVSASLTNLRAALSLTALNTIDPITLPFNPASGVVMDDILTALGSAMASNPALSYTNLLASAGASAGAAIAPPAGLNTALVTAYIAATSISLSGVTANGVVVGGKLIAPVHMGIHTYYYWDASGDGSSTGVDYVLHDLLDQMFNGGALGDSTKDTTDAAGNIVTLSNGFRIHLLTQTELSALYAAQGVPANWNAFGMYYASATQFSLGRHNGVNLVNGAVSDGEDNGAPSLVAFELLSNTNTSITATANTATQNLTVGTAISISPLTASGGTTPYTYSHTGTLPAGLSFDASTGVVAGTPTAAYTTANLVFSVKDANNLTASITSTVSFTVTAAVATNTAAYYFNKRAVGNTWTWNWLSSNSTIPDVKVRTVTASTGGLVTTAYTYTFGGGTTPPPRAETLKLDATGAWVLASGAFSSVILPATFSVGTTWVSEPADLVNGTSAVTDTVKAFNVTRTVPAGTFTDCLQVDSTFSFTNGSVTTINNSTRYYSPTVGLYVDGFNYDSNGVVTGTEQLQAGYIANP